MRAAFGLVVAAACVTPAAGPVAPAPGYSGPPGMAPGAPVDGPVTGAASAAPRPGCLPALDPVHPRWLDLARIDDRLVACADDHRGAPSPCWAVDATTGALVSLDPPPALPGYGARAGDGLVAGTAAIHLDADTVQFEGAAPRPLHDVADKRTLPAGVTPAWLWSAGATAFVLGSDDLLYLYVDGKPSQPPFHGLRGGGVGVSGGEVVVHEGALSRLTVMDGLTRRTTHGRTHHDEPCHPDDDYAPGHEPDAATPCGAYLASRYRPYLATTIIADADGYVGIDPRGAVFTLDEHLAETARVPVAVCAN
jgi:hypothetical protein